MKSERTYPVYKVNKHAEGLLVGGHPWVYENDILEAPGTTPENGTLVDVVSPKGAYLGTGFLSLKSKIRVRLISRNANDTFDTAFCFTDLGLGGFRLPLHFWRGRPVPRPDSGPFQQCSGHPDPERGHGKAEAGALPSFG